MRAVGYAIGVFGAVLGGGFHTDPILLAVSIFLVIVGGIIISKAE